MPNWCSTEYQCIGEEKELKAQNDTALALHRFERGEYYPYLI